MKINKFLIAAMAATTLFASCSKSDEGTSTADEMRTVKIKVGHGETTRAVGSHVANATAVTFTSGHLLFTTQGGVITKHVTIAPGNAAESGGVVGIGALEADNGTQITNVPGSSTVVYFVGNPAASFPAITVNTTNISAITGLDVLVAEQYDATNKGVEKVALYGKGPITLKGAGPDYEAKFDVSPVAARMEIGKITAAGNITSYKVEGIFINNYYAKMDLDGTLITPSELVDNLTVAANYATGSGSYTAGLQGIVYDYSAAGIGTLASLVTTPNAVVNANDVWGYNLLAPTSGVMNQITIRISGVALGADVTTYAGTYFVSIKNLFSDMGTNLVPITTLAKGNIYRIPNITFTENDLTTQPLVTTKKVDVEVTMLDWISTDIGHNFN